MQLRDTVFPEGQPVQGYGPGFFRIGDKVISGGLLVVPGHAPRSWRGIDDLSDVLDARDSIDVLFFGTGAEVAHIPDAARDVLETAGIGVEIMASPAACRTYNVLLSEGRRIGLAALPV